jgi:transposase
VKTLLPVIEGLKKRFNLGKVTIVADSGVLSGDNLKKLEEEDYSYIVAARLKSLPDKTKEEISDLCRYQNIKQDELKLYETEYDSRRLVVTWSKKRALRDEKERKKLIEKLKKSLSSGKKGVLTGRYSKYLKLDETPELKNEAIKEDSKFDGLLGLLTNNKDLQGESLAGKYKELWKIEESFRLMKSQLEVRPMFHWSDKRISGHLMLCFLAFVVMRELERKTKEYGIKNSLGKMLKALSELQVSELDSKGEHYLLRSKVPQLAERIFKAMKMKVPPSFQPIVKL